MNIELCRAFFAKFAGKTLLSGFSGGADSSALLLVARHFQSDYNYRLIAVTLNHHLRPEAAQEVEYARNFCQKYQIEFVACDLEVDTTGNIESAAREARLKKFAELSKEYNASAVLLGHHLDDRLENLFLRLGRGANTSGITSPGHFTQIGELLLVRPLLEFSRAEIESFLHEKGIFDSCQDSSNADESIARNALRHRILPELYQLFPSGKSGFESSINSLEADAAFLDEEAQKCFANGNTDSLDFWQKLHVALVPRVLRLFLRQETGSDVIVSAATLARLARSWGKSAEVPLNSDLSLLLSPHEVTLKSKSFAAPEALLWQWGETASVCWGKYVFDMEKVDHIENADLSCAFFDAEQLAAELTIRELQAGDKLIPFGKTTPVKLKKLRIDRKIPAFRLLPVVTDPTGEIIWAPFVRHGGKFNADNSSKIIKISVREK